MTITEFYLNTAIAAMQGIQENGSKLSIAADLMPKETAKIAFDIADAMVKELKNRNIYVNPEPSNPSYGEIDIELNRFGIE